MCLGGEEAGGGRGVNTDGRTSGHNKECSIYRGVRVQKGAGDIAG